MPIDPHLMNEAAVIDGQANADTIAIREQAPATDTMDSVQILAIVFSTLNILLERIGPHWIITPTENAQLADVWAPILDKHFPAFQMSKEWGAIGATAMIMAPKYITHEQLRRKSDGDKSKPQEGEPARVDPRDHGHGQIPPNQETQPADQKAQGNLLGSESGPQPIEPDPHATAILHDANLPG